eukprot:SAG11_NODE_1411_length_4995_cov_21.158088_4_plen_97_part_00
MEELNHINGHRSSKNHHLKHVVALRLDKLQCLLDRAHADNTAPEVFERLLKKEDVRIDVNLRRLCAAHVQAARSPTSKIGTARCYYGLTGAPLLKM